MPINTRNETDTIIQMLQEQYGDFIQHPAIQDFLSHHIGNQLRAYRRAFLKDNPFEPYFRQLRLYQPPLHKRAVSLNPEMVRSYQRFCQFAKLPFDKLFWETALMQSAQEKALSSERLLTQWRKALDQAKAQWELMSLTSMRQSIIKDLQQYLDPIHQLKKDLKPFDMDLGIWFDHSIGQLTPQNVEIFMKWASYFAHDKNAQKIAALLGRLRSTEKSYKIEVLKESVRLPISILDTNSKEEMSGIRLAKDIEHTIPAELALMVDNDTRILFALKYLETNLTCFELEQLHKKEQKIEREKTHHIPEKEQWGPMILCVDTSGSMQGTPEHIAKAMALYLANLAKLQKRPCFIINFSTKIELFEAHQQQGIGDLVAFLQKSFHGGTDIAPALQYALSLCQSKQYAKADVIIFSDFVMHDLSHKLLKQIREQKDRHDNQFHSLVIGDLFIYEQLHTYFEHEWIYNPRSHKIQQLVQFKQNLKRHHT